MGIGLYWPRLSCMVCLYKFMLDLVVLAGMGEIGSVLGWIGMDHHV